jgi:hypothetical protein
MIFLSIEVLRRRPARLLIKPSGELTNAHVSDPTSFGASLRQPPHKNDNGMDIDYPSELTFQSLTKTGRGTQERAGKSRVCPVVNGRVLEARVENSALNLSAPAQVLRIEQEDAGRPNGNVVEVPEAPLKVVAHVPLRAEGS